MPIVNFFTTRYFSHFLDYIGSFMTTSHLFNYDILQGVHELKQRTFEPLLKKLAHEIWIAI